MITLACGFKEVFELTGLAAMQTLLKCLLSNSSLHESLTFSIFSCRPKEDLLDTMLCSLSKEIVTVDIWNFAFCQEAQIMWVSAKVAKSGRNDPCALL